MEDSLKLKPFKKPSDKVMKPSKEDDAEIMTDQVPTKHTKHEDEEKNKKDERPGIDKILPQNSKEDDKKATTKPGTFKVHVNSHGRCQDF